MKQEIKGVKHIVVDEYYRSSEIEEVTVIGDTLFITTKRGLNQYPVAGRDY